MLVCVCCAVTACSTYVVDPSCLTLQTLSLQGTVNISCLACWHIGLVNDSSIICGAS